MHKVSINKKTGLLIESQTHADDQTMIDNAVAMGLAAADVELSEVDDAGLAALIAARDGEDIQAQIDVLEAQTMLPRVTREFMLTFMETNATPQQLAGNIGYTKVKALDDQIRALRAKMK